MKFAVLLIYTFLECAVWSVCLLAKVTGNYRLPTDAFPTHYSLKFRPYTNTDAFDGEVTIHFRAKNILDRITLHSADLNITEASINRIPVTFVYENDEKLSLFYANESIQPGEHALNIKYRGVLVAEGIGFLKAKFKYNDEEGHLFVADFEPTGARKAFPCFDEPAFKSKFNVRLIAPDHTYNAISNMPEINRFKTSSGVVYDFATTVPMSTYLVSFAITQYPYYEDVLEEDNRKLPIRVFTFNASQENNEYAINCTKEAIKFYTEYTNISYPLSKLDMIEYNRIQSAATENWGLITFREGLLTLNLGAYDKLQISAVIHHELAHFWFGNLVTNDWWNDIWLQEGFATYMSYKLNLKNIDGTEKVPKTFFFDGYIETYKTMPTRPIVDYLATPDHLKQRFDNIVYEKGAFVLHMINVLIGEEAFQKVIRTFLKRHAYKTATTNDFITTIEEIVPQMTIRDFVESYLYQNRFPMLTVDGFDGKFVVKQQVCSTIVKYTTTGQRWTLPVTYITNENKTPSLKWFDKDMDELTVNEPNVKWILFNTQDVGIYRVSYSVGMWQDFIKYFQEFTLEESEFLIEEAIYSFKFGLVDCGVLLNLMKNVKEKKQWHFLFEFHEVIRVGLQCNGYKEAMDIYANFLRRRFNETNYPRPPTIKVANCQKMKGLMDIEEKNINLASCAKWITDNLNENGNNKLNTRRKRRHNIIDKNI